MKMAKMEYRGEKMFKLTRKAIYLAHRSWLRRQLKGELWRYFLKLPKEDARSRLARLVDVCGTLLLLWTLSLLLLNHFGAGIIAPIASTGITVVAGVVAVRFQKRKYREETLYRKMRTLAERQRGKLKRLANPAELAAYVWPVLHSLPQFGKEAKEREGDIYTTYQGVPVIVKFIPSGEGAMGEEAVQRLAKRMEREGYRHALLISPDEFDLKAKELAASLQKKLKIALVGEKELLLLLARAQKQFEPPELAAEKNFPSLSSLKQVAIRREKTRSYLAAGTFLLASRFIFGHELPVSNFYLFLAIANFLLAFACFNHKPNS